MQTKIVHRDYKDHTNCTDRTYPGTMRLIFLRTRSPDDIYVQTTDSKMPTTTFFVREDAGCQLNSLATILLVIASGRNNLTSYRSVFFTLAVANLPAIKRARTSLEICEQLDLQMGFLGCE